MSVINLNYQTFILPLIVIQWDFCLHKESDNSQCSTQRSDLIIIQSVWNDMKKQNKLRQTKSRGTVATSPRCFKRPTCKGVMIFILYKLYFLSPYTNPTPKPTPYRKLSAFLDFQKTSFCMIYKLVCSWGPKIFPTRTRILPSVCGHFVPI